MDFSIIGSNALSDRFGKRMAATTISGKMDQIGASTTTAAIFTCDGLSFALWYQEAGGFGLFDTHPVPKELGGGAVTKTEAFIAVH